MPLLESENSNHSAEAKKSPAEQEPVLTAKQMDNIREAEENARRREQENPNEIDKLRDKINQLIEGPESENGAEILDKEVVEKIESADAILPQSMTRATERRRVG